MNLFNSKNYGPWQFTIFRMAFGVYLAVHFFSLIPYAQEVFGPKGMIADPSQIPTYKIFPNILNHLESDLSLQGFLLVMGLFSLAFAAGLARKFSAIILWYGWAALFNRNIFIANPSIPYVGWLLLASAVISSGEPLSLWPPKKNDWKMNPWIFNGAWILLIVGYTFSGIHKAAAESWQNGMAIKYVLELPTTRDYWFKDFLLSLPDILHQMNTWSTLLLEIFFLPLCLFRKTRVYANLAMLGMHLGILSTVSIADLTFGMLMYHLFVVESDWGIERNTHKVIFFDGVCGLCDRFITFMVDADRENVLKFSTQQGEAFQSQEVKSLITEEMGDSIFYLRDGKIFSKSTAVLTAMSDLGGVWKLTSIFKIIPRPIRDLIYDMIAKNRYKLFGKHETCRLPTPEERAKFMT
jgi:predicted DCC family thiol-disulfide oxidoreductase YuxK